MTYELMGRIHAELLGLGGRLRDGRERGQGTVEYVGLVLLLAVVLSAVIAAAHNFGGAKAITETIMAKVKEAIGSVKATGGK